MYSQRIHPLSFYTYQPCSWQVDRSFWKFLMISSAVLMDSLRGVNEVDYQ